MATKQLFIKKTDGSKVNFNPIVSANDVLPDQTGKNGRYLKSDGTDVSWATVDALPDQSGQSGKFLTSNGTSASWAVVDALPSQAGHGGKFLTTNGAVASWGTVSQTTISTTTKTISVVATEPQSFTLGSFARVQVYLDGVLCTEGASAQYTVSGNVVIFNDILPVGMEVKFVTYSSIQVGAQEVATPTSVGLVKPGSGMSVDSEGALTVQSATAATNDGNGNPISSTYLKLSGGALTGAISLNGVPYVPVPNTVEAHNCLYRGKEHTVEGLSAKVQANDFSDIFIGDYFKVSFSTAYGTVANEKMLVAGINYFKNCGNTATTTPHLVMIPENGFGSAQMNSSNTTSGGYKGSAMHSTVLPTIASALKNAIGSSHVVSRRYLLSNTMNSSTASMAGAGYAGASTGWEWVSCDLCLMSEPMVYGTTVFSSSFFDVGDRKQQLPIFALNPQIANTRSDWWLSSVALSAYFAVVDSGGFAGYASASDSLVIRPLLVFA